MINKIIMKNVASYKDESTLETNKKINLIYGLNGTGKSTFSNYFNDIDNKSYSDCKIYGLDVNDTILVYNQQFIKDNFYEKDDIKGIFSLSKENKEAKTIIDNANKILSENRKEIDKCNAQKDERIQKFSKVFEKFENKVWKIKSNYSGGDRVLEYCLDGLKGSKADLFNYLIQIPLSKEEVSYNIEDLKNELKELNDNGGEEKNINNIDESICVIQNEELLEKVIVGNKDIAISGLISKLNNADWVKEGLKYVGKEDENAVCPFCQQKTITKDFIDSIKEYFDLSYEKDINSINEILEKSKNLWSNIENYYVEITKNKFVIKHKDYYEKTFEKIKQKCIDNIQIVKNKIKNPSQKFTIDSINEELKTIENLNKAVNDEINKYNEKIKDIQGTKQKIKNKFWTLMRKEYDDVITLYNVEIKNYNKEIVEIENKLKELENNCNEQKNIILENQKKTVNIVDSVNNIKKALIDIGISDFTIEKFSDENALYRLRRDGGNNNIFSTLSEGEKMVISFLYFLELCKGTNKKDSISGRKIVVIDDPISSLSHIFIFNIERLIGKEFYDNSNYEQVFILTHSLYFFYELTMMKSDDREEKQKLFRIYKNENGSSIIEMKYEEIQNDYQAYWHIIKDREQSPALIANCMRNVIEYFFNFVEKSDLNNVFQKKQLQSTRFSAFNRYINRESHSKGQNIFDIKEFDYESFKEAFRLVFELTGYENHYKKMMR